MVRSRNRKLERWSANSLRAMIRQPPRNAGSIGRVVARESRRRSDGRGVLALAPSCGGRLPGRSCDAPPAACVGSSADRSRRARRRGDAGGRRRGPASTAPRASSARTSRLAVDDADVLVPRSCSTTVARRRRLRRRLRTHRAAERPSQLDLDRTSCRPARGQLVGRARSTMLAATKMPTRSQTCCTWCSRWLASRTAAPSSASRGPARGLPRHRPGRSPSWARRG